MMRNFGLLRFRIACIIVLVSLTAMFAGCGGGGGGSSTTGVSPVELEVQTSIDSFSAAVRSKDLSAAMNEFDSSLRYYPANATILGGFEDFNQFRSRLSAFFTGAVVNDFTITSLAVNPGVESAAMARGLLSCNYNDSNGNPKQIIEQIEMKMEKVSKWGITELYAYNNSTGLPGMQFPPQP